MKTCANCQFWLRHPVEEEDILFGLGECRRFPPQPTGTGRVTFVNTSEAAWCGEHKGKPGRPKRDDSK